MSKLHASTRNAIPARDFAGPDRSYPIPDESHARAALSMGAQHASPEVLARIRAHVARKFPSIKQGKR